MKVKIWQRSKPRNYYWIKINNGSRKLLHRHVWELYNGKIPEGCHIHHLNGNPACNCICNLQLINEHDHMALHRDDVRRSWQDPEYRRSHVEGRLRNVRKVRCLETQKVYESIIDARRQTGISDIGAYLSGRIKAAHGYHWEFIDS